ncbi:YTH domain protein [Akanthomyces lecanii RCEF 1005]|uniref:YTH domain protein n=1 Tax=Akanthomyces lecanii RCEF 1005 TaxID=1081108 RepID=A0A162KW08_CORDF|nr:YTH domain protein [Akanthomyces lecanii RCEF 1005]
MAPMASALPHGGYQHPASPGVYRQYSQQTSPPVMQHMPHNPYAGHHPASMMLPGYYMQQPQMHQYYAANGPPGHHPPHSMQGRGNSGYYPVPFVMDHPQSPGYYPQPPQFPEPSRQRPDYMMNRQNSQGHIPHEGRNPPRRPSNRTTRSFRDQTPPSVDTKRQQQNMVRGPPRKPHQSGHAIWIGNLPPQTELMDLVHHVCELAPGLQSLFLISKSNCAFANFKEEITSVEAQKAIHESKFQSVRLVCRLRKNTAEATAESPIVIAAGTSNPSSPTLADDPPEDAKSPTLEKLDPLEASVVRMDRKDANGNAHRDRFFVLKSLTREDLEQSVKTSIWATQSHNEKLLNNAFQTTDNVYLVFSANKSGEYFGFARMTSEINQDPDAAIQFAPQNQTADESDLPQAVTTEAKDGIPKGRIIDDSARGTMFWEIEGNENEGDFEDETDTPSNKEAEEADEDMQTRGKPFNLQWLSIAPLPFYRTRGLRNPWNSNREVKIARDGTELEPSVGRRLISLMNHSSNPGQPSRFPNDPRGAPAFFDTVGRQ